MPTLNDKNLNEILDAFIHAELNPSSDLIAALANATEKATNAIKNQYIVRYQRENDTDEDPFETPVDEKSP
jgi:hypothetical protein